MLMGRDDPCCALFLLITSLLLASSQVMINALPQGEYPVTYVLPSWDDIPNLDNDNFTDIYILKPILFRANPGVGFVSGFWCNVSIRTIPNCLFSIVIIPNLDDLQTGRIHEARLVWSANRNKPVGYNTTLRFTQSGDLILAEDDGSIVWSTNTGGKSVSGLNLTEEGNLVLFDRNNATVWQSFDHPTDSLLLGQKLDLGQKLIASASSSNWSQGIFVIDVQRDSFNAYADSNPPRLYYSSSLNWNITPHPQFENGSFNGLSVPPASSAAQFMKLEPNGHLMVYQWVANVSSNWHMAADLLTQDVGVCGYPLACGKYSICSDGQCICPPVEDKNGIIYFMPENYWQPNQGCFPVTPIFCNDSQYHSLLELQNTSDSSLGWNLNVRKNFYKELDYCKKECLNNCSCKAVLYLYGGCLLVSEVFTLTNADYVGLDNATVFLKVQSSPTVVVPSSKKSRQVIVILGSSLGAFFGVVLMVVALCLFLHGKDKEPKELDEIYLDQIPGMPSRFSYEDLKMMTNDFTIKLGEGGFGSVFEGTLSNGTKVAVKRLDGLGQIKKSFLAEVETIGSIHHVNLVRLIGFCAEKTFRLLVYEYMSKGSLDKWIFHKYDELTLGWQSRRKIILDIAKGLAYLHEDCTHKIFHLDIKPQNILLDENLNAKVSDFGLSKLIDKDQSQVVTTLRGTPGYMAPEWLSSIITEKVDVYSFGVVVLEILCGRKNLDRSQPEEDMHLLALFKRKAEEGRLPDIIDKHHDEMQLHEAEVIEMMRIAVWCLQSDFVRRPPMSVVVNVLEGLVDVETNLDYSFTKFAIPRKVGVAGLGEDVVGAATTMFPSILSGPRQTHTKKATYRSATSSISPWRKLWHM